MERLRVTVSPSLVSIRIRSTSDIQRAPFLFQPRPGIIDGLLVFR
jgi:hypothetical protein